jgi:DNA-directed RNA polymerase subunit RPC12/RpoP
MKKLIWEKRQSPLQEKRDNTMIENDDLRSCENCGNVFLKKIANKLTNRCPACNVWKKDSIK